MTFDQVKEIAQARPFRPFSIETAGGKNLQVLNPDTIFFGPDRRTVVVFDPQTICNLVDASDVVSVSIRDVPT